MKEMLKLNVCGDDFKTLIEGDVDSRNLVVLAPGMLYDLENLKEHDILKSIKQQIADKALMLTVDTLKYDHSPVNRYEATIDEQANRIGRAIENINSMCNIREILYVSHSVGALAVRRWLAMDQEEPQFFLSLVPPSPYRDETEQVKSCTERLVPKIAELSDEENCTYLSRDGHHFVINNVLWDSIDSKLPNEAYPKNVQYIVSSDDRVFPKSYEDLYKHSPENTIQIADQHSIKQSNNIKLISNIVEEALK